MAGAGEREREREMAKRRGGKLETRRILKTFAVLLIFFSKWVKLFYDFQRQFLATGGSLSLSFRHSPFHASPFLSSSRRVAASRALSEAYFLVETAVFFHRELAFPRLLSSFPARDPRTPRPAATYRSRTTRPLLENS